MDNLRDPWWKTSWPSAIWRPDSPVPSMSGIRMHFESCEAILPISRNVPEFAAVGLEPSDARAA